eukprot:33891_6
MTQTLAPCSLACWNRRTWQQRALAAACLRVRQLLSCCHSVSPEDRWLSSRGGPRRVGRCWRR